MQENIGNEVEVLIEKHFDKNSGYLKGVTKNYLTVILNSKDSALLNTLQKAKVKSFEGGKLYDELFL